MKYFLLILDLIFTCAAARAAEQAADPDYAKFAAIQTISSDFSMEKRLSIAQKPLVSSGHFYFERPGFLRWEYKNPFAHGIILDGAKAFSWRGAGAKAGGKKEIKDISAEPWAKAVARQVYMFVAMDIGEISARYNTVSFENGLSLLPKDNSASQAVEKINLYFNAAGAAVKKVEMLDKSGDSTIITFSATMLNEPIPQSAREP